MLRGSIAIHKSLLISLLITLSLSTLNSLAATKDSNLETDRLHEEKLINQDKKKLAVRWSRLPLLFPNATNLPFPDLSYTEWKEPKFISNETVYPDVLKRTGQEGRVKMALLINEDGRVIDTKVMEFINKEMIDAADLSVRKWKFTPALIDGVPYKYVLVAPLTFSLTPEVKCQIKTYGIMEGADETEAYTYPKGLLPNEITQSDRIIEHTDFIPLTLGVEFGFEYGIENLDSNAKLAHIVRHPLMALPNGQSITTDGQFVESSTRGISYTIANLSQALPGTWELVVSYNGRELCGKTFTLVWDK